MIALVRGLATSLIREWTYVEPFNELDQVFRTFGDEHLPIRILHDQKISLCCAIAGGCQP